MSTKTVLVYSTVGQNKKEVNTSATIWSALKSDLASAGVNTDGMSAVVGQTQVTLESADAQIPEGNFTLFLVPQKVKSGWLIDDDDNTDDYDKDDAIADLESAKESIENVLEFLEKAPRGSVTGSSTEDQKLAAEAAAIQAKLGRG